jgi:hypothetical protein
MTTNKKLPLWYKDVVVGYQDEFIIEDGVLSYAVFYLFDTVHLEEIIDNISRSTVSTLTTGIPDKEVIENNNMYQFDFDDNFLTIRLI